MKIALACSAGGHLTEMLCLESVYKKYPHFFLTFAREDSKSLKNAFFINDPKRNPLKVLWNMFLSLRVFHRQRPDVVITTGAGVAVPFCYMAKLLGKKVIYIESFCRVEEPSLTGRLLYPIADVFLVQWKELQEKYGNKAQYWGGLV